MNTEARARKPALIPIGVATPLTLDQAIHLLETDCEEDFQAHYRASCAALAGLRPEPELARLVEWHAARAAALRLFIAAAGEHDSDQRVAIPCRSCSGLGFIVSRACR